MTKVSDNFHSPPMVMAPWVDYGNYPTHFLKLNFFLYFSALWGEKKRDCKDPRCIEISTVFFTVPRRFYPESSFLFKTKRDKKISTYVVLLVIQYIQIRKKVVK